MADSFADIATIPNPKPARVCVTVAELGRGAKVFIPSHIYREIILIRKCQKVEIDCIAIAGTAV
jgi:hypothetical protein